MNDIVINKGGSIVYLGIGSNIDPEKNIIRAIHKLKDSFELLSISRFWESDPIGRPGPKFLNGVAVIQTNFTLLELKQSLRAIEKNLGRVRSQDKYAPRQIDIDILIFSGEMIDPDVWTQPYITCPLAEVYPTLIDPNSGATIMELSQKLMELNDISPREDLGDISTIKRS